MANDTYPKPKVAAVQAAPVFLNREATIEKMRKLTEQAKKNAAAREVFPESFIPTFPVWCLFMPPVDQHAFYKRLYDNSVSIPSPAFNELQRMARDNAIFLSVGICEKGNSSTGKMWNTNLLFDRQGNMVARHRKLLPTWAEKLVWAFGDGSSLNVHDTELGRVGALICGENTNTLARYAMVSQGEQLHISTYPPCWPTSRAKGDYYDVLRVRACAHSFEGKLFTIVSSASLDEQAIEEMAGGDKKLKEWLHDQAWAGTFIIGPNGQMIGDPIKDNKEGIVYAECDIALEIPMKGIHDIAGAYQRFDVFQLTVNKTVQEPVYFTNDNDVESREYYPFNDEE